MYGIPPKKGRQSPPPQPLSLEGGKGHAGGKPQASSSAVPPPSATLTPRRSAYPTSPSSATFHEVPLTPDPRHRTASDGLSAPATAPNPSRWDFLNQGKDAISQLPRKGMELLQYGKEQVQQGVDTAKQMSFRDGAQAVWNEKGNIAKHAISGGLAGMPAGSGKDFLSGAPVTAASVLSNGAEGALRSAGSHALRTFVDAALPQKGGSGPGQGDTPQTHAHSPHMTSAGLPAPATAPNPPGWDLLGRAKELPRQGMELFQSTKEQVQQGMQTAKQMSFRDGAQAVWNEKGNIAKHAISGGLAGMPAGSAMDLVSGAPVTTKSVLSNGAEGVIMEGGARALRTFVNGALPQKGGSSPGQGDIPLQTPTHSRQLGLDPSDLV